jgi:peptidoglycan/LPS O-acetylase OafA/YrhL
VEALGLVVAAVFAAISTAQGHSSTRANGLALTVLVVIIAGLLAAIAVGLARVRPWTRVPAVMTQLVVIVAGVVLLDGHRPEWGVPALVLAMACLAGLLTPASLRALNRSADELPFRD